MKNKQLIVLIGCSGSGKSTEIENFRKSLSTGRYTIPAVRRFKVCSADHFFYDTDGKYNFDYKKIKEAHAQCQENAVKFLTDDFTDIVFIDNTNVRKEHRKIYEDMAKKYNAEYIEKIIPAFENAINGTKEDQEEFAQICAKRNLHNVPYDVILRTIKNYD